MPFPTLSFIDRVIFNAASGGGGAFVEAGAVPGYQTMEAATAVTGAAYGYAAQSADLTQWEVGYGTWTLSTQTLTRIVLFNSNGNINPVSFNAAPQVMITALGESLTGAITHTSTGIVDFATPSDASSGVIPDSANYITVQGLKTPGDGGEAAYKRVNSLPVPYVGSGSTTVFVPPSFTSGGYPVLCFSTTTTNQATIGPTIAPITAGCLTVLMVFDLAMAIPSTLTDSAGNVYLLAVDDGSAFTQIYYCANPVFAPIGTTIAIPFGTRAFDIYCFPGFTGAVLDKTATLPMSSGVTTGISLSTGVLGASPELVIGMAYTGGSPAFTTNGPVYSLPVGWFDLSPPITGRNPIGCTVVSNTASVAFAPTWSSTSTTTAASLATFKTYPGTSLNASFWELSPSSPLHTAAFGIDPAAPDNVQPFRNFGHYLATIAPASGGVNAGGAGTPANGTVAISIGNPAVITVTMAVFFPNHGLRNGSMISFSTTGHLPTGIVAGQIYYVQYGTVTQTTFQISETSIFDPIVGVNGGQQTVPKGTSVITSGTQSGTHSYTTYGQSWFDFVLDPGVYYASQNQFPGIGTGIQKWRASCYGARLDTNADIYGSCGNDINANTSATTFAFWTQFQSTIEYHNSGNFNNYVILNTAGQASNFYVNSWVALMAIETQASANGNWNPGIFEYAQIKSIDAGTGTITFWDRLQYNYRSTYPKFVQPGGGFSGALSGPGTIVQLSDIFDQEIEIHGLNMYCVTEGTVGGVWSLRLIDCDFWGWAFSSGPSPVLVRRFTMENCRFHNCVPEVDKMIDYMLYADCDFDQTSFPRFQSASINKVVIDRCRMQGGLSGTPKELTIRDSYIAGTFTLGPVYGSTQRMTLVNSYVERTINNDQASAVLPIEGTGITFVNGTIKIASGTTTIYGLWAGPATSSICPAPWAQPGAKIAIEVEASVTTGGDVNPTIGTCGTVICFTVLDVYVDGSNNFCVDTDLTALPNSGATITGTVSGTALTVTSTSPVGVATLLRGTELSGGGLPANTVVTADNGGMPFHAITSGTFTLNNSASIGSPTAFTARIPMNFLPHSCPRLTVINCTGGRFVADMAGAPPDIPMYSYFKRAYAGFEVSVATQEKNLYLSGNLLNLTINVIKPYTGAGANYVCHLYVGGYAISSGITYPTYILQSIDLKTAGVRTITSTGVTGNVGADSISAIPFWINGIHLVQVGITPSFVRDGADTLANMPFFVMTAQTDQGIGFSDMVVNTVTTGIDEFADTTTGASLT